MALGNYLCEQLVKNQGCKVNRGTSRIWRWGIRELGKRFPKGVGLHTIRAYEEVLMWLTIYIPSFRLLCAITHLPTTGANITLKNTLPKNYRLINNLFIIPSLPNFCKLTNNFFYFTETNYPLVHSHLKAWEVLYRSGMSIWLKKWMPCLYIAQVGVWEMNFWYIWNLNGSKWFPRDT